MALTPSAVAMLIAALVLSVAASPATHAAEDDEPSGGPVTGSVIAERVYSHQLGLCSIACRRAEGGPVSDLPAPDHDLAVDGAGEFTSSDEVGAGSYRIRFDGEIYADVAAFGYLRHFHGDRFKVVEGFERGTAFTVEEGAALDLGTLNLQVSFPNKTTVMADGPMQILGGGYVTTTMRAKRILRGAKIAVRSYGCGGVQTKKVIRKSGSFNFTWTDPHADRHYGRTLRLDATISKPGRVPKLVQLGTWDTSSLGWKCAN